jgi:hypothetical protein
MNEQKGPDKEKRLQYSRRFIHFTQGDRDNWDEVFSSDEAWFCLIEYIKDRTAEYYMLKSLHTSMKGRYTPEKSVYILLSMDSK